MKVPSTPHNNAADEEEWDNESASPHHLPSENLARHHDAHKESGKYATHCLCQTVE